MEPTTRLTALEEGQAIVYGGDRVAFVDEALAAAFSEGDRLIVVQSTGDLLHLAAEAWEIASSAVESIARQPEASGDIRGAMILTGAFIEGVCLFAVVVTLLAVLGIEAT